MEINIALATTLALLAGIIVQAIRGVLAPDSRWVPIVALIVGAGLGALVSIQTGDLLGSTIAGLVGGAMAAGIWPGTKAVLGKS